MKVICFPDTLQPKEGELIAVIGRKGQANATSLIDTANFNS